MVAQTQRNGHVSSLAAASASPMAGGNATGIAAAGTETAAPANAAVSAKGPVVIVHEDVPSQSSLTSGLELSHTTLPKSGAYGAFSQEAEAHIAGARGRRGSLVLLATAASVAAADAANSTAATASENLELNHFGVYLRPASGQLPLAASTVASLQPIAPYAYAPQFQQQQQQQQFIGDSSSSRTASFAGTYPSYPPSQVFASANSIVLYLNVSSNAYFHCIVR
jgi:hypothetical protein